MKKPRYPISLLPNDLLLILLSYLSFADQWALLRALSGLIEPPLLLKRSTKPLKFFEAPKVVRVTIPPKPDANNLKILDGTFVTQLQDKRLLYCYEDGSIGLFSSENPSLEPVYSPLLPAGNTTGVFELPNNRLIITQTSKKEHRSSVVDLNRLTARTIHLPKVCAVKSVFAISPEHAFMGTENGYLIQFDLDNNRVVKLWHFPKPANINSTLTRNKCTSTSCDTSFNNVLPSGLPILCISTNYQGGLFLVFDVKDGYVSGLFNQDDNEFRRGQFFHYKDVDKIGKYFDRIFYNRYGGLTIVLKCSAGSFIYVRDFNYVPYRRIPLAEKNTDTMVTSAFTFPSGDISFASYPLENDDICSFIEIQQFSI